MTLYVKVNCHLRIVTSMRKCFYMWYNCVRVCLWTASLQCVCVCLFGYVCALIWMIHWHRCVHHRSVCASWFIGMCFGVCVLSPSLPSICLPLCRADPHICLCLVTRPLLLIDLSISFNQLLHLSPICCHISVLLISPQLKLTAQAAFAGFYYDDLLS